MNKNIKFAIYFLLGIVLFYLMFNGNGVEGFGQGVNFIYVKVDAAGSSGTFERFVKLDADADAAVITSSTTELTPDGLQSALTTTILDGDNLTYYKSESGNLFIQKVTDATPSTYTGSLFAAHNFTSPNEQELTVTVDGVDQTITLSTDIETAADAVAALVGLTGADATKAGDNVVITSKTPGAGTIAITGGANALALLGGEQIVTGTDRTTEYYLVMKSDATPPVISSIHKITTDLSSLTADSAAALITGTGEDDTSLYVYNLTPAGQGESGYQPSPNTTTVTIDTIPRCSRPENASTRGYNIISEDMLTANADFSVNGSCIPPCTGSFSASGSNCSDTAPYILSGCNCDMNPCDSNPCKNGGTCIRTQGSGSEYTCDCTDNYIGTHCQTRKTDESCSDFTGTCPDGKEINKDKNCSGACTLDECCEEESNLVMIGIGICLLIFCIILIGGGAYLTMGKKSSGPPIKSGPPGY